MYTYALVVYVEAADLEEDEDEHQDIEYVDTQS